MFSTSAKQKGCSDMHERLTRVWWGS